MENFEEKACLCALNRIFGFEPKYGQALISHCGSAADVFKLKEDELEQLLGPFSKYRGRICTRAVDEAAEELLRLSETDIVFCGMGEDDYPPLLPECEDPPIGLYIRTSTPLKTLWNDNSIAVVGTRDISPYGREWCEKIVRALAETDRPPLIVSGLALGTDITAHRSALEAGMPTIGVMATGPESVYPSRHHDFATKMCSTEGCALITDYPPGTAPLAIHFLRRNRIIAGLSRAVLLVESKIRGGGMMTCRLAFSYNRDVYCLPGRADDIRSQGCNELIRQKIAEPITSLTQLTQSLGMLSRPRKSADLRELVSASYTGRLSEEDVEMMAKILLTIRKNTGICIDEVAAVCNMDLRHTCEAVNMLEIDGFISIDLLQRCSIKTKKV